MMSKRIAWILSGLLALPLTGCWDNNPLDDQGIVMSIGIFPSSQKGDLRWIFTFPNVTLTPSSLANIKADKQYYDLTVNAPTFAEAVMKAQEESSRIVYFGQLHNFMWPTTLSWQQLWPVVASLNDVGSVPKTFWVMATKPSVKPIMKFVSPQVVAPRTYMATYFDCSHCQPIVLGQREWKFWSRAITPGINPYAPVIDLEDNKLAIRQILVYPPSGRPVVYSPEETRGFGFLSGKIKSASLWLKWKGRQVGVSQLHDSHSISARKAGDGIRVDETIRVKGFIEQPSPKSSSLRDQNLLRQLAQQRILSWCLEAIHRANETHTDPFGYAESVLWSQDQKAKFLPIHARITVLVSLKGEGMLR